MSGNFKRQFKIIIEVVLHDRRVAHVITEERILGVKSDSPSPSSQKMGGEAVGSEREREFQV